MMPVNKCLLFICGMLIIGLIACTTVPISDMTCEDLGQSSLRELLEQDYYDPFTKEYTQTVTRIKNVTKTSHTDKRIECAGTVKYSNAKTMDITFHYYMDEDGDTFIGYEEK